MNRRIMCGVAKPGEKEHCILTVGYSMNMGEDLYGYGISELGQYGGLSRIPYWIGGGEQTLTLKELYVSGWNPEYFQCSLSTSDPMSRGYFYLTINGTEFAFEKSLSAAAKGDTSIFMDAPDGEIVPLVFTPPPDGYLEVV